MKRLILTVLSGVIIFSCTKSVKKPDADMVLHKKEDPAAVARIAENYVTEGINYHKEGNDSLAVRSWRKALELIPNDAEVHNFSGIGYHNLYNLDDAEYHFLKAIELKTDYYQAYNNLGYVYYEKKQYDEALKVFNKSHQINPDFEPAQLNIQKTKAILDGNLSTKVLELSEYASSFEWDLDKQVEIYRKVLDLDSNYVEGHNNISVAYFYSGMIDSAYIHLNKALWLDPNYPQAINNMGYIYKIEGRYEEAIALFLKASSIKKRYVLALNNLGETYQLNGEFDNARRVFKTVLELVPSDEFAKDSLEQLSVLMENEAKKIDKPEQE